MKNLYSIEEVVSENTIEQINDLIRREPSVENWGPFIMHPDILSTSPYKIFLLNHFHFGIVGYCILMTMEDDFTKGGEIFKLYVLAKYRGTGFASKLIDFSIGYFKSIGCQDVMVEALTHDVIGFWQNKGFSIPEDWDYPGNKKFFLTL